MGRGKVRMQEDDLKARRKLKDKEDRTGQDSREQRTRANQHWARGSKREGSW